MNLRFRTNRLRKQARSERDAVRAYRPVVGRRYLQRLQIIANAASFEHLYEVRTMRLHPLDGDRVGFHAIKLTGFDRLIISYEAATQSVWIEEVSKHYGD